MKDFCTNFLWSQCSYHDWRGTLWPLNAQFLFHLLFSVNCVTTLSHFSCCHQLKRLAVLRIMMHINARKLKLKRARCQTDQTAVDPLWTLIWLENNYDLSLSKCEKLEVYCECVWSEFTESLTKNDNVHNSKFIWIFRSALKEHQRVSLCTEESISVGRMHFCRSALPITRTVKKMWIIICCW